MIRLRSETRIPSRLGDWLDVARGLAAVQVLAFHSYQLMFLEQLPDVSRSAPIVFAYSVLWALSAHGFAAVMVFFVLSGYLVGGPALVRSSTGRLSATDYFSARLSRLYVVLVPALALSVIAYVGAKHMAGWDTFVSSHQAVFNADRLLSASVSPETAACNALFLQTIICSEYAGNLALWSLSNEFWYYILIFALLSVRRHISAALLVAAILGLFVIAERHDTAGLHTGMKFFFFFLIWCVGALAYAIVAPIAVWLGTIALSVGAIYLLKSKGLFPGWAAYYLAIGMITAAAILSLEHWKIALPSCLRFTKSIAKWSFSLYAIHYPLLVLLNVAEGGNAHDFTFYSLELDLGFVAACVALAIVFYWLFERRTDAVRIWLKDLSRRAAQASRNAFGPPAVLEAAGSRFHFAGLDENVIEKPRERFNIPVSPGTAPNVRAKTPEHPQEAPSQIPQILLNDGHSIPQLGFGVWQITDEKAPETIRAAIQSGYRLIDTAATYGNEAAVGQAIKMSGLPHSAFCITTKLWNESHGYDQTLRAFDDSAARLGVNVIDLYLIHWPCPQRGAYVDTWRAFIELQKQGRIKSIGVSNFTAEHLQRMIGETGVVPAVNQIELYPGFQQHALREIHRRHGIVTESWSPLGHGSSLNDQALKAIADRHGKTPAQVVLRWHIENGLIAIPKSASPARMAQNIDIFDFELSKDDHVTIAALDRVNGRMGPDPTTFGRPSWLRPLIGRSWR